MGYFVFFCESGLDVVRVIAASRRAPSAWFALGPAGCQADADISESGENF